MHSLNKTYKQAFMESFMNEEDIVSDTDIKSSEEETDSEEEEESTKKQPEEKAVIKWEQIKPERLSKDITNRLKKFDKLNRFSFWFKEDGYGQQLYVYSIHKDIDKDDIRRISASTSFHTIGSHNGNIMILFRSVDNEILEQETYD